MASINLAQGIRLTRVPDFGTISTSPSSARRSKASRTGVRLTPNPLARSFSDSMAPGGKANDRMSSCSRSCTKAATVGGTLN